MPFPATIVAMTAHAPSLRRTVAQQEQKSVWKYRFWMIILFVTFGGFAIFLWQLPPRQLTCRTVEYTICPTAVEQQLQPLHRIPYRQLESSFTTTKSEILAKHPTLIDLALRRKLDLTIEIILTPAQPLFPVQRNTDVWLVHDTGILTIADDPRLPIVTFATESAWISDKDTFLAPKSQRQALGQLWQSLQGFPLSFKRLELIEPTSVVGITTNSKQVIFSILSPDEVQRQLATLQSFLHSSTMEEDWHEVDVRFTDIIIR